MRQPISIWQLLRVPKLHLDLTRLRAKGQLLELDQRDLRFTSAESEAYLIAQLGARGKKEAAQIHELTDGWVAGLQLIAADRRGRRLLNRPLADTGASTSAAPVPDPGAFALYFEREVLLRLEPDKLQLLVNASICDTVSAALCAALSGQPDPNRQRCCAFDAHGDREPVRRTHSVSRERDLVSTAPALARNPVHHVAV
jgi:ATP/maltotriose-dependent transcriptional regulator MalT